MVMAKYGSQYHVRSTSLPSASHPLTARAEQELYNLRVWAASKLPSVNNLEVLQDAFCGLLTLYESVEDLLLLPSIQQVIARHRGDRCVDKVLDGTLRQLDVNGTTRDVLVLMKDHVQETQSALRRRKVEFDMGNVVHAYTCSSRKMNKVILKQLYELRKLETRHPIFPLEEDQDLVAVMTVLREVQEISLKVFESLLNFMSGSRTCTKQRGWSLASKLIYSKRVTCEEQHQVGNQVGNARTAVLALSSYKCPEVAIVQHAQEQLQVLEEGIGNLENRLECVYKRFITTRVALLNILSN